MVRRWTRPLFQTRFPGPGVSVSVKRSIGGMDLGNQAILRTKAACERLKLKCEVPFYLDNCCSHLGIPSKRLAIWMRQSKDSSQWSKVEKTFEGTGWKVVFTTTRQIEQMTDEELTAHLEAAVKELGR